MPRTPTTRSTPVRVARGLLHVVQRPPAPAPDVRSGALFESLPADLLDLALPVPPSRALVTTLREELFVWFEDTSSRADDGQRGIAGLPESLLPVSRELRVIDRRFAENHLHLLSAVRISCAAHVSEHIASIYTAALAVGTVAWIGSGSQYARAWDEMYRAV